MTELENAIKVFEFDLTDEDYTGKFPTIGEIKKACKFALKLCKHEESSIRKSQPREPIITINENVVFCCEHNHPIKPFQNYCSSCGQAIAWNADVIKKMVQTKKQHGKK